MADEQEGQQLSQQDVKDLQEIASKLPQGHPMVPKISTLLNAQPTQFEKERPSSTWDVVTGPKVPRPPGGGEEAMLAEGAPPALAGLSTIGTAGALKTNPLRAIRGLIGAGVGGSLGERGGRDIGSLFGPTGGQVGGAVGAVGGGLLGGGLAGGLERNPATSLQSRRGIPGQIRSLPFGIQRFIPEWMVPKGELGSPTNPGPFSELPPRVKVAPPEPELGSPENPGLMSKIPTGKGSMPAPPEPPLFGNATSTANPVGTAELPPVPQGKPTPFPGVEPKASVAKGSKTGLGRSIILPGETIDPEAVKNAGSAAQATAERLQELAKFGDRAAADELVRRRIAQEGSPRPVDYRQAPLPRTPVEAPTARVNRAATPLGNKGLEVPKAEGIKLETDSNGTRWAVSGKYRVSIPKTVSDAEAEDYAKPKLKEQAQIHKGIVK